MKLELETSIDDSAVRRKIVIHGAQLLIGTIVADSASGLTAQVRKLLRTVEGACHSSLLQRQRTSQHRVTTIQPTLISLSSTQSAFN